MLEWTPVFRGLRVRVLITASGIQDYIFSINHQAAGKRLRGRSARLGLVLDRCRVFFEDKFKGKFKVIRNAGSRLELEFSLSDIKLEPFLEDLQRRLDEHSLRDLDGQVWFVATGGEGKQEVYRRLAGAKLQMGGAALQLKRNTKTSTWNVEEFIFQRQVNERGVEKEEASDFPEARLGQALAHRNNKYIYFTETGGETEVEILGSAAKIVPDDSGEGFRFALGDMAQSVDPKLIRKRLARYAPLCEGEHRLCDFDEIAEKSTGAKFLGVLKADVDNLGKTFADFPRNAEGEKRAEKLSNNLEELFTEQLESLLKSSFADCYIVYSGGDDLFILGPWDQLIRFADAFHSLLNSSVKDWQDSELFLSAGFRLAHPKSPVRHLASDVEVALEYAKGHRAMPSKLDPKNRICIFERILAWSELRTGLAWADQFIQGIREQGLSTGFLQRLQWYGSEFRRYESGKIDGLRMAGLLQNDWYRNKGRLEEKLRAEMDNLIGLLVRPMDVKAPARWREIDFATRFALYAARQKGESPNG